MIPGQGPEKQYRTPQLMVTLRLVPEHCHVQGKMPGPAGFWAVPPKLNVKEQSFPQRIVRMFSSSPCSVTSLYAAVDSLICNIFDEVRSTVWFFTPKISYLLIPAAMPLPPPFYNCTTFVLSCVRLLLVLNKKKIIKIPDKKGCGNRGLPFTMWISPRAGAQSSPNYGAVVGVTCVSCQRERFQVSFYSVLIQPLR